MRTLNCGYLWKRSWRVIEKGIPLPPRQSKYREIAQQMEPGDSMLFQTEQEAYALRHWLTGHGMSAATRKMRDGWRVWRLPDRKPQFGLRAVG